MIEKIKKYQRALLISLIVVCIGIILIGGIRYIEMLRGNLQDNAIQNIMTVTTQHRQAFDNFISADQERLHSYAEYFSANDIAPEDILLQLAMFHEVDAIYSVICLDEGLFCSSVSDEVRRIDAENLEYYHSLSGSGVRDSFLGLFSGLPKFGYYETFTFRDGHQGLIQKTYERNKVSETFSLSLYNGQGYGYVLNRDGDILLRSVDMTGDRVYDNVFDALSSTHNPQENIDALVTAMERQETGSIIFRGDNGDFVYTYTPVESVDNWYLLSIVPVNVIRAETDRILQNTRMTFGLLALILIICAVFVQLIWHTQREIKNKEQSFDYQSQLFNIFTTYLSNNTDDLYMMFDHATEALEYVSPNLERVLGIAQEEVTDYFLNSDRSADPEAANAYYAEVRALTPGEAADSRTTERINPKTGERKFFLENTYCVDIQGHSKRVVYFSDRTRERESQNSLAEALRMAQAANKAKSTFLSSISHDIRTPMNAIIGFLALMRDEADDPRMVLEYTQRIDAASQHLLGLINDVLDMNKIDSGTTTLNISEMNLAEVIDELNTIIRPQARAKKQTFDIFVSPLKYEYLLGDKMRISQILINLLSNAVKYTPEHGTIEVRVAEMPQVVSSYSRIRFTIKDNGLGMSEEYQKVIFDPFTREETTVTHEIQGTGLGMAITKSLIDLMGGTIRLESELGRGSTFTVELELRIQEQDAQENDLKFWTDYSVTKMIVADDDEDTCRNIVNAMAKTGVITDYATDGQTALQMMRSAREAGCPYGLILLDWQMPDLDGLETARLIRRNYSDKIPILLLTAYDWSDIKKEAMEIGVNHFMAKPFFMSTFKEAIRRVMDNAKQTEDPLSDVVRDRHILVVDDIEVNRIILVKILGTLGAVCDTAVNGQDAVEKFEASGAGGYDLILMDVQMPVMNGYEATVAIRGCSHPMAKTIPIIAMTANAFADDVRSAIESGMDAHIAKPVQIDNLKSTIRQVFDAREAQAKEPESTSNIPPQSKVHL
ncbi:MAG: response regulator [bacterium]|nr:response regulator [bacterium]